MRRPGILCVLCFAAGIVMQDRGHPDLCWTAIGCGLALAAAFLLRRTTILFLVCLMAAFILAGAVYHYSYQRFARDHIYYALRGRPAREVAVTGTIVSDVEQRPFGRTSKWVFELKPTRIHYGTRSKAVSGKILVNLFKDHGLGYGDVITVAGKLYRPYDFSREDKFSYKTYLNRKGIYCILSAGKDARLVRRARRQGNPVIAQALRWRNALKAVFSQYLSGPEAGLMQAMLLGDRSHIPRPLKDLFAVTGTAHILAISGLHIGIVAGFIFILLKLVPMGRRGQYLLTILFLAGYVLMTGGRPSVIRATIMAVLLLGSFIVEREVDVFNSLAVAGFVILVGNPANVFDVGFQLSFLSVFSIVALFPVGDKFIKRFSPGKNTAGVYILQSMVVSAAAWIGVAGLIAYYFEIITPAAVLANLFVVPLMTVIVALGLGLLLTGSGPAMASGFALCLKLALNVMVGIVALVARIPGCYVYTGKLPLWMVFCYYAVLGLALVMGRALLAGENRAVIDKRNELC